MPLNMHEDCKKRLIETLTDGIPQIEVTNGMFLERLSCVIGLIKAEQVIPDHGKLRNQLISYIDEYPIIEFVSDTLAFELVELDKYLLDTPKSKLTTIGNYGDPRAVAVSLVERIESLPWEYTLSIKLPDELSAFFATFITEYRISPRLRLARPNAEFLDQFPLNAKDEKRQKRIHKRGAALLSLFEPEPVNWNQDAVYLQIGTVGFIGPYGGSLPALDAQRILKAFCGLGVALRLFSIDHKYTPMPLKAHLFVHKRVGEHWEIDGKLELSDEETQALNSVTPSTLDGHLNTNEKKVGWALTKLDEMRSVFSGGEKTDAIILASQWLFDSNTGRDSLLNYVQAMVVLEILLGDKAVSDEIGLGELLSNRCAYLIGDSHAQRAEVLREFKEIYRIRSQIVHSGKHRLAAKERVLFNSLRWMCRRVIQEEVRLLRADTKKEEKA